MTLVKLAVMPEEKFVDHCYDMGFFQDWWGKTCPRCKVGTLGPLLQELTNRRPAHKCNAKPCRAYILPEHSCSLLSHGPCSRPPRDQVMDIFCLITTNSVGDTVKLTGHDEKAVQRSRRLLLMTQKVYVQQKQKDIDLGASFLGPWPDVEVDETTVSKAFTRKPKGPNDKVVVWDNWLGIVARGHPQTLVLERLRQPPTKARSPGPGPISKDQWRPLARKWLQSRKVVMHSDSARAYRECIIKGVARDHVVHKKRRIVDKTGKVRWLKPIYVRTVKHKLDGKVVTRRAGTQTIDRAWGFLKARIHKNQHTRPGGTHSVMEVRSAQWHYWIRGRDPWVALGTMLKDMHG